MKKIGIFGTFDVENFGDLLFPIIAERELKKRIEDFQLLKFSYYQKESKSWSYDVVGIANIQEDEKLTKDFDLLLIGGGHLIRFDKIIANNYPPPNEEIPHPTGYWLTPALAGIMAGIKVAWNAPGSSENLPKWCHALLNFVLSNSQYVSVRDKLSLRSIKETGFTNKINVVPDTAFSLAKHFPKETTHEKTFTTLGSYNINKNYIIVQASPPLLPLLNLLVNETNITSNFDILALPIGPILGDNNSAILDKFPFVKELPFWPSPEDICGLISHSQGVISLSLHLSIAALCFGLPVLRPQLESATKHSILQESENVYYGDQGKISETIGFYRAVTAQPRSLCSLVLRANQQLEEHWNAITNLIINENQPIRKFSEFFSSSNLLIKTQEKFITERKEDLEKEEQVIKNLNNQLEIKEHIILNIKTKLDENESITKNLKNEFSELKEVSKQFETKLLQCENNTKELGNKVADQKQEILFYSLSKSWRFTRPFRKIMKIIRGKRND